jgi:hypothetical protein
MSLKNEITHDPKAAAWSALSAFRATFPAPTAENRAIEARLEADLTALREADGSLFDDRADELIRWADKNEARRNIAIRRRSSAQRPPNCAARPLWFGPPPSGWPRDEPGHHHRRRRPVHRHGR